MCAGTPWPRFHNLAGGLVLPRLPQIVHKVQGLADLLLHSSSKCLQHRNVHRNRGSFPNETIASHSRCLKESYLLGEIMNGGLYPGLVIQRDQFVGKHALALVSPQAQQVTLGRGDAPAKCGQASIGGRLAETISLSQDDSLEDLQDKGPCR